MPRSHKAALAAAGLALALLTLPRYRAVGLHAAGEPEPTAPQTASEQPSEVPPAGEAAILDAALNTVDKLADPYARAQAAARTGEAYAALGFSQKAQEAMAKAMSASLESSLQRHLLLQTAEACVRAKLFDQAVAIADRMDYVPHVVQVLCAAASGQVQEGLRDHATATLGKAEEKMRGAQPDEPTAWAWTKIADVYAQAAMIPQFEAALERAMWQATQVRSSLSRSMVFENVAGAYLRVGRVNDALRVAEAIEVAEVKVPLLGSVAEHCAGAGDGALALNVLAQAGQAAGILARPHRRANMLASIANTYSRIGRPDMARETLRHAEQAAAEVSDQQRAASAWDKLASAYAAADDLEAAERIVRDTDDPLRRGEQFVVLALKWAKRGDYERAVRAVKAAGAESVALAGDAKLRALGEAYYNAWGKDASSSRIENLEPRELMDAVLAHYAGAWAAAADYAKASRLARAIGFEVTRDDALRAVATSCLVAAKSSEAARPAFEVLGLLTGRLDKLRLRNQLAAKQADLTLTQEALASLQALEKDVQEEQIHSARAELLGEIALTYHRLGRKEQSRHTAARAIGAALKVACARCRDEVIQDLFDHMSSADYMDLAFAAAEQMDVAALRADNFMRMFEMGKGLTSQQAHRLLREALSAGVQTPVLPQRIELLARLAADYRKAGLMVTDAEQEVLRKSYEALPTPAPPEPMPVAAPVPKDEPLRIHLAYFDRPGCPLCEEVKASFEDLRRMFPHLTIETYNLATSESAALLNVAICTGLSIPEVQRLVAPSIFSSRSGLIGQEVSLAAMAELARSAEGLPFPQTVFGPRKEEARAELGRTYEGLGLLIVGGAGLADGVNPCAFTVIIFFLSYLAYLGRDRREIAAAGIVFTVAVFLTYFGAGLLLAEVLDVVARWSRVVTKVIYGATAVLALLASVLSIRDGLRCLRGQTANLALSLPDGLKTRIRLAISKRARLRLTVAATAVLGTAVALFELPCTGQTYVPTIIFAARHLPDYGWGPVAWLLLYNLCFIVPLVAVFAAVFFGLTAQRLTALFRRHIALTKFALALVFALLSTVMIVYLAHPRWIAQAGRASASEQATAVGPRTD